MIKATLPQRHQDAWGSGDFGASRGSRTHKGIDYLCYPDTAIHSLVNGTVTKRGYPYGDDLAFRYVEITDEAELRHRYFYVQPGVGEGAEIEAGQVIGWAQDIASRYSDPKRGPMGNHIHMEILAMDDTPINPDEYFAD